MSKDSYPAYHREVFFSLKDIDSVGATKDRGNIKYKSKEIKHEIPDFVELPKNRCEKIQSYEIKCLDCGFETFYRFGNCDDPKCFIDHVKWSKIKAHDGGLRVLEGIRKVKMEGYEGELWHLTLSPPENADKFTTPRNEEYLDKIIPEVYEMCKSNGIYAGTLILHYGSEKAKKGVEKYLPAGGYRPHVHVFGYGERPEGPWSNQRGSWVVKTLNKGRPVERDFKFIRNGLQYQLSHALRRAGKHAIRWFGEWSYSKGLGTKRKIESMALRKGIIEKNKERNGREIICECPKCGGDMVKKYVFDGSSLSLIEDISEPPPKGIGCIGVGVKK